MTKRLAVPTEPDEFVDRCHFSRSGFAIWNRVEGREQIYSYCTCEPARKPKKTEAVD